MELIADKRFEKDLKRFLRKNPKYGKRIKKSLDLLASQIKHPSLRLHKLSGSNNYSVSVDMSIRIIIHFWRNKILLLRIGKHEEVY